MCIECLSCVRFYIHYLTLPMLLMGEKLLISMLTSEEGNFTPLRYSCLENPMDGGAWWAAVCGVAKSRTRLSDFIFTFHFHALEKEMSPYSSALAWRIPWAEEPGWLLSMGLQRVVHDWVTSLSTIYQKLLSLLSTHYPLLSFHPTYNIYNTE